MYDTIIIGAGMSGLAAGIRLAHYDQKVCILERHYTIGGLNSFYRMNGRDYDVGLHAVTNFTPKVRRRDRWHGSCDNCVSNGKTSRWLLKKDRGSFFQKPNFDSTTTSNLSLIHI